MKISKGLTGAILGLTLLAAPICASVPAIAAPIAPTSVSDLVKDDNFAEIQEVFNAVNAFRASKGLAPVNYNVYAANVAQDWSDYMGAEADFSHNPDFATDPRISGTQWSGEIIAARWDRSGTALVKQWINSDAHNATMSDPNFTTIGIGITYTNETGKTFETTGRAATYGIIDFYRFVPNKDKTFANPLDAKNNTHPLPTTPAPVPVPVEPIPTPTPVEPTPIPTDPAPAPGVKLVTPTSPTFDNWEQGYTVPVQTGVIYSVNGKDIRGGTYNTRETAVKITAKALNGYVLNGTAEWSYKYTPTYHIPKVPNSPGPVKVSDPRSLPPLNKTKNYAESAPVKVEELSAPAPVQKKSIVEYLSGKTSETQSTTPVSPLTSSPVDAAKPSEVPTRVGETDAQFRAGMADGMK